MAEVIEKEFSIIERHDYEIEKLQGKIKKVKTHFDQEFIKVKKEENAEEMELSDKVDTNFKTLTKMLGSLRSEVFGQLPTKKETDSMIKEQIEAIQIKIKNLEP